MENINELFKETEIETGLQQKIGKDCFLNELLNFHKSLEVISSKINIGDYVELEDIFHFELPSDIAVILPCMNPLASGIWLCVSKQSDISFKVSKIDTKSLVLAVPHGKRVAVLLKEPLSVIVEL